MNGSLNAGTPLGGNGGSATVAAGLQLPEAQIARIARKQRSVLMSSMCPPGSVASGKSALVGVTPATQYEAAIFASTGAHHPAIPCRSLDYVPA
ncbi:hypothetical protein NDU88_005225 [Pleurodeles waltl]|uniref:Uncharacterized protein n=1 Tax=Pleurodeles waltl TaxID=8319 RepID=A0AAV7TA27_PLEWA|nr:hypothetical protein NDU88_005225 [Pleurodeles waltl]